MIVKLIGLPSVEPRLLVALASTVKVPCAFVGLGNVSVKLPLASLVVVTGGENSLPDPSSSSTVTLGLVTPIRSGVATLVYPGDPVTSLGESWSVGAIGLVGGVRPPTLSVNVNITLLPTEPALSVAKISIVFVPLLV